MLPPHLIGCVPARCGRRRCSAHSPVYGRLSVLTLVVIATVLVAESSAAATSPATRPPIVVVEQLAALEGPSTDSMVQPTDVVVDSAGTVWALDGVHLRIAKFEQNGKFVSYLDLVERKQPEEPAPKVETAPSTGTTGTAARQVPSLVGGQRSVPAKIFGPPEPVPTPTTEEPDRVTTEPILAAETGPQLQKPLVPENRLPVGLGLDRSGRLLVGNRHTGQIEIRGTDGKLVDSITIPKAPTDRAADPTDILASPSGDSYLVVDNDNHCVKVVDSSGRLVRRFGGRGDGSGEMFYPATAALTPDDRIMVVDVLNARVDVFGQDGSPKPPIGSRGITAGKFYRPKGVAIDRSGRVLVTDSFTGLVQVFESDGRLAGIWGDSQGRPLRLRSPASIFVDAAGRVYVVEMMANRVSVWRETER